MKFLKNKRVLFSGILVLVFLSNLANSQLFDFIQKKEDMKSRDISRKKSIFGASSVKDRKSHSASTTDSIFGSPSIKSLFNYSDDNMMKFKETGRVNNNSDNSNKSNKNNSNKSLFESKSSKVENKIKSNLSNKANNNKGTGNLEKTVNDKTNTNKSLISKNENKSNSINSNNSKKLSKKKNNLSNLQESKTDNNIIPQHNPQVSAETEQLSKQIEDDKHQMTEIELQQKELANSQRKELQDLEKKYREINDKTRKVQKLFAESKSLQELKETTKKLKTTEIEWDNYIKELTRINSEIQRLKNQIENLVLSLQKHQNSRHLENMLTSSPIENTDIENNLYIHGDMKTDHLLTSEMKLLNKVKITENVIEVPSSYIINVKGRKLALQDLIYYNKMAEMIRRNCGDNLNCFETVQENNERRKKEEIIQKTIKSIRKHLDALKN